MQGIVWDGRGTFPGENSWARGYSVSTIGRDKEEAKKSTGEQEKEKERLDQLRLDFEEKPPTEDE